MRCYPFWKAWIATCPLASSRHICFARRWLRIFRFGGCETGIMRMLEALYYNYNTIHIDIWCPCQHTHILPGKCETNKKRMIVHVHVRLRCDNYNFYGQWYFCWFLALFFFFSSIQNRVDIDWLWCLCLGKLWNRFFNCNLVWGIWHRYRPIEHRAHLLGRLIAYRYSHSLIK